MKKLSLIINHFCTLPFVWPILFIVFGCIFLNKIIYSIGIATIQAGSIPSFFSLPVFMFISYVLPFFVLFICHKTCLTKWNTEQKKLSYIYLFLYLFLSKFNILDPITHLIPLNTISRVNVAITLTLISVLSLLLSIKLITTLSETDFTSCLLYSLLFCAPALILIHKIFAYRGINELFIHSVSAILAFIAIHAVRFLYHIPSASPIIFKKTKNKFLNLLSCETKINRTHFALGLLGSIFLLIFFPPSGIYFLVVILSNRFQSLGYTVLTPFIGIFMVPLILWTILLKIEPYFPGLSHLGPITCALAVCSITWLVVIFIWPFSQQRKKTKQE